MRTHCLTWALRELKVARHLVLMTMPSGICQYIRPCKRGQMLHCQGQLAIFQLNGLQANSHNRRRLSIVDTLECVP